MEKIYKKKDHWGQNVIYVQKCKKYKYENQEKPKKRISHLWFLEN